MIVGTILGLGASAQMIMWPHREDIIAQTSPGQAAMLSFVWALLAVAGAYFMPRTTGSFAMISMFGALIGAVGALFSEHPVFCLIFLLWAVIAWIAQTLSRATLEALAGDMS